MPRTAWISLSLALLLAAPATLAGADDGGHIDYRQKLMGAIGADMGAISDVLKYQLPLTSSLPGHAASLVTHADLIEAAFERQVVEGPTDAKAEIWQDPEGFREAIAAFRAEAEKLRVAGESGDMAAFGTQLRALGKSCNGCHKGFRKPKEESFRNR